MANKAAVQLKSALGKANSKGKGKQCLRDVSAARINEISDDFIQQAADLASGVITVSSGTYAIVYSELRLNSIDFRTMTPLKKLSAMPIS